MSVHIVRHVQSGKMTSITAIEEATTHRDCWTNPLKGQNNRSSHIILMEECVDRSASHLSFQPEVIEQKL